MKFILIKAICLFFLCFYSVVITAAGTGGHILMSKKSLDYLETGHLLDILSSPQSLLYSGSIFPDFGYAHEHSREYAEESHWSDFHYHYFQALKNSQVCGSTNYSDSCKRHVSMFMGSVSHGIQDEVYDQLLLWQSLWQRNVNEFGEYSVMSEDTVVDLHIYDENYHELLIDIPHFNISDGEYIKQALQKLGHDIENVDLSIGILGMYSLIHIERAASFMDNINICIFNMCLQDLVEDKIGEINSAPWIRDNYYTAAGGIIYTAKVTANLLNFYWHKLQDIDIPANITVYPAADEKLHLASLDGNNFNGCHVCIEPLSKIHIILDRPVDFKMQKYASQFDILSAQDYQDANPEIDAYSQERQLKNPNGVPVDLVKLEDSQGNIITGNLVQFKDGSQHYQGLSARGHILTFVPDRTKMAFDSVYTLSLNNKITDKFGRQICDLQTVCQWQIYTASSTSPDLNTNEKIINKNWLLEKGRSENFQGTALVMQDDGNLVLYDSSRMALWASNTNQKQIWQCIFGEYQEHRAKFTSEGDFVVTATCKRTIDLFFIKFDISHEDTLWSAGYSNSNTKVLLSLQKQHLEIRDQNDMVAWSSK